MQIHFHSNFLQGQHLMICLRYLTQNVRKKQERINEFVEEILEAYPPEMEK